MQSVYWIAFVAGGIFVVLAVIGGIDGAEIDFAGDIGSVAPEFEAGGIDQDVEFVDTPSKTSARAFNPLTMLASFRFWTFGACFFGLTGLLVSWVQPQRSVVNIFFIALLMGLFIGGMVSFIFHRLKTRLPNSMTAPDELVGLLATVEIPIQPSDRGKIRFQYRDSSREIPARTNENQLLEVGDSVIIIGIEGNQAWVVSEGSLKQSAD